MTDSIIFSAVQENWHVKKFLLQPWAVSPDSLLSFSLPHHLTSSTWTQQRVEEQYNKAVSYLLMLSSLKGKDKLGLVLQLIWINISAYIPPCSLPYCHLQHCPPSKPSLKLASTVDTSTQPGQQLGWMSCLAGYHPQAEGPAMTAEMSSPASRAAAVGAAKAEQLMCWVEQTWHVGNLGKPSRNSIKRVST